MPATHPLTLLFLPEDDERQGADVAYNCFLLNQSEHSFLYEIEADTLQRHLLKEKGKIEAKDLIKLPGLYKDDLNDKPIYRFCFWSLNSRGTGPKLEAELSLQAKKFFSRRRKIEGLDRMGYPYEIALREQVKNPESIQDYTRKQTSHLPKGKNPYSRRVDIHNPEKRAGFPREIDLHIPALRPDAGKMDPATILYIQLQAFENYLNEAIRLGIEEVLIIHGKGEGILRERIHRALDENPHVKDYEKTHHIFGMGATTVFL